MADLAVAEELKAKRPITRTGEPVWEIAYLFPNQGAWSVEEYLALDSNRLIEYFHGYIEVLPIPTFVHQFVVRYFFRLLDAFTQEHNLGDVFFAPLPVRLGRREYREPDIIFLSSNRSKRLEGEYLAGADLVVEVVSGGARDRKRDLVTKRRTYARAGIQEYWIIDPRERVIIVLWLDGNEYTEHGRFTVGMMATSILLPGFTVSVDALFAAASSATHD
jgi:Uma2 family endonuclease